MLSIMELRSRHSKKASRACQQWARAFRLGASKAPSVESLGLSIVVAPALPAAAELGEAERRPIWCVYAGGGGFFWFGSGGEAPGRGVGRVAENVFARSG